MYLCIYENTFYGEIFFGRGETKQAAFENLLETATGDITPATCEFFKCKKVDFAKKEKATLARYY